MDITLADTRMDGHGWRSLSRGVPPHDTRPDEIWVKPVVFGDSVYLLGIKIGRDY